MRKKIITKKDFLTLEQFQAKILDTPEKKARFEEYYKEAKKEFRANLLIEIGQKVKHERKKQGITQSNLAKKLKTSQSTINRIESGNQNLTIGYLDRLSCCLGLDYEVRICSRSKEQNQG